MTVKWGVIGCGDIARRIGIPAIRQASNSRLVAVMSRDADRARRIADQTSAKRSYTRIADLLADDEINAVYIATPPSLHCDQTRLCAVAGKHVLCEKPMAINAGECADMIRICADNHVQLGIAYYRRFYPKIQKIKEILENGRIGEAVVARVQTTLYYNPPNPEDSSEWRTSREIGGGGCLIEIGSHRLDLLAYLFGDAAKISAFTNSATGNYEVEDSAYLIAEFAGGAYAIANFHWNTECHTDEFEIHGTRGRIVASPLDLERVVVYCSEITEEYALPRNELTHLPVVENFVRSINGEERLLTPGRESIKASRMIDAAYAASKSLRAVLT